jgi:hypothetical protein
LYLAERHPALAQAVMAPLICWFFSSSMFKYFLVDHEVGPQLSCDHTFSSKTAKINKIDPQAWR